MHALVREINRVNDISRNEVAWVPTISTDAPSPAPAVPVPSGGEADLTRNFADYQAQFYRSSLGLPAQAGTDADVRNLAREIDEIVARNPSITSAQVAAMLADGRRRADQRRASVGLAQHADATFSRTFRSPAISIQDILHRRDEEEQVPDPVPSVNPFLRAVVDRPLVDARLATSRRRSRSPASAAEPEETNVFSTTPPAPLPPAPLPPAAAAVSAAEALDQPAAVAAEAPPVKGVPANTWANLPAPIRNKTIAAQEVVYQKIRQFHHLIMTQTAEQAPGNEFELFLCFNAKTTIILTVWFEHGLHVPGFAWRAGYMHGHGATPRAIEIAASVMHTLCQITKGQATTSGLALQPGDCIRNRLS